ncbi:hypothetical protein [Modestobacter sp. SSW1-42]|uniref:hypothetical protein n=1 Tax=Modestobacter sp. SSW1-42 TaxID=596372 RepID=UPI0039866448
MTTSEQSGRPDRGATGHPAPDPLAMSPAEKIAAEWEARHDVAARGRRAVPGAVQHYLAESRAHEVRDRGATRADHATADHATQPRGTAGGDRAGGPEQQAVAPGAASAAPVPRQRRRRWLPGRRG